MIVCGVSFKENGKVYNFDPNDLAMEVGNYIIVETEKGEQLGKVTFLTDKNVKTTLKKVVRVASEQDYNKYLKNLKDAKDALVYAKTLIDSLKLKMQLIDSSYTFDRKQLLFNFIADERIDFRELVKQLALKYKTRIELHQMGVRDKAKEKGGIGPCGRQLCCSDFLNHIDTITINMAKNQNIALNPNKINGACGRLLCCLSYEDDYYLECRKCLPQVGTKVKIDNQMGTVVALDLLNKKYKVDISGEIRELSINDSK